LVKVKDKRRLHQNPGPELKIQLEIKLNHQSRHLYLPGVATWPNPGHENAALVDSVGGALLLLSLYALPRLIFSYKYWVFRDYMERSSRDRFLGQFFILFSVGFSFPFHVIFSFHLCNSEEIKVS